MLLKNYNFGINKQSYIYIHVYEEKQFHALKNYNFGIIFSSSQGFLWEKNQN